MTNRTKMLRNAKHISRKHLGCFITFEGIEGSGKTTQCRRLAHTLRNQGYTVLETREPGGTLLAEAIRHLLLNVSSSGSANSRQELMTPQCETLLILASRSQHVTHVIRPALQQGMVVLCDRFFDSTLAYQGYGRGIDLKHLDQLNMFATQGLNPDLTLLFDLPVSKGLERRRTTQTQNRLDQETKAFHERVRKGFFTLTQQQAHHMIKINSGKSVEYVAQQVDRHIASFLSQQENQ